MTSLRSRLILGCALIAVVPLATAMTLLAGRIQGTVRADADARLGATLDDARARLADEGERVAEKLELLARDPQLKRLDLAGLADSAETRDRLATQQFLLDLDYLWLADSSGHVIVDAASAPAAQARATGEPLPSAALAAAHYGAPRLVAVAGRPALALDAARVIANRNAHAGALRGGVVLDSTRLESLARGSGVDLVLFDGAGRTVATSFGAPEVAIPRAPADGGRVMLGGRPYFARDVALTAGDATSATLAGYLSTAAADDAIAELRFTSLLLGALGVALAVILGVLWSRAVSRPVERLAAFSEQIARGESEQPLALESVRELQTLVAALERLRGDLHTTRERVAAGARQAAYGEIARQVAHEIRNPLAPIAVSVSDLRRSYEQQRPDFGAVLDSAVRVIGDEVAALERLLREFSEFGRFAPPRPEPFDAGALLDDLRALYPRELADGRLAIADLGSPLTLRADRAQLRQALINLVKNGLEATAGVGHVAVAAAARDGALEVTVSNDGPPLTDEQRARLFVPGFTTKAEGSGLGLAIVERIVNDHGGTIAVESAPEGGACFRIRLPAPPPAAAAGTTPGA